MTDTAQTIAALALVALAVIYLGLRARKKRGCGKSCGCDAKRQEKRL